MLDLNVRTAHGNLSAWALECDFFGCGDADVLKYVSLVQMKHGMLPTTRSGEIAESRQKTRQQELWIPDLHRCGVFTLLHVLHTKQ